MDDQQGNLIDGTARARQWRRSRPKPGAAQEGDAGYSDAPKSMAGSLLVPAELLALEVTDPGAARAVEAPKAAGAAPEHVNPFLAPGHAGLEESARPRHRPMTMFARLAHTRQTRRLLAVGSGLLLVSLAAVAFALLEQRRPPSHVARTDTRAGLNVNHLAPALLAKVASSNALGRNAWEVRGISSPARRSAKPRSARLEAARRRASRSNGRTPHTSSTPVSHGTAPIQAVSRQTVSVNHDSAASSSASAAQHAAPVQATPQQAPPQQTAQQPVHYQPPPQPAGPAGLGSQVGSNCNPKCS